MSQIRLKNIKIYAHHGCLEEEKKIGSEYLVNLTVSADLSKAASSDSLNTTIDYVDLFELIKKEMAIRSNLLENVADRILKAVFTRHIQVDKARITVSKLNPPIGGNVESVDVTLSSKR